MHEYMKILPKYMLFWPQGASIQSKSSFKTKPNKKYDSHMGMTTMII